MTDPRPPLPCSSAAPSVTACAWSGRSSLGRTSAALFVVRITANASSQSPPRTIIATAARCSTFAATLPSLWGQLSMPMAREAAQSKTVFPQS